MFIISLSILPHSSIGAGNRSYSVQQVAVFALWSCEALLSLRLKNTSSSLRSLLHFLCLLPPPRWGDGESLHCQEHLFLQNQPWKRIFVFIMCYKSRPLRHWHIWDRWSVGVASVDFPIPVCQLKQCLQPECKSISTPQSQGQKLVWRVVRRGLFTYRVQISELVIKPHRGFY